MRLREPTEKEKSLMARKNVRANDYYVIEPDTDNDALVLLHKRRGRRRTIER